MTKKEAVRIAGEVIARDGRAVISEAKWRQIMGGHWERVVLAHPINEDKSELTPCIYTIALVYGKVIVERQDLAEFGLPVHLGVWAKGDCVNDKN